MSYSEEIGHEFRVKKLEENQITFFANWVASKIYKLQKKTLFGYSVFKREELDSLLMPVHLKSLSHQFKSYQEKDAYGEFQFRGVEFKPDYYKIVRIIPPNVLKIESANAEKKKEFFVKMLGVHDNNEKKEVFNWLQAGNIVRVIPKDSGPDGMVLAEVWLGNTYINAQFSSFVK